MIQETSVSLYFAFVNTDGSGEDLDQVIMHLLFVLIDRLLPGHVSGSLHILLCQKGYSALEEFNGMCIGLSIVSSQKHRYLADP